MIYFKLLLLFVVFETIHPKSILFKIQLKKEKQTAFNNDINIHLDKSLKATLYSALIPGLGQYLINDNKVKGSIMFGLEAFAIAGYSHSKNKANKYKNDYKSYGDIHWDFADWCSNYYNWNNSENEFFEIFTNNDTGVYPEISEDSHHINFWYNNDGVSTFVSTSSISFQELYNSNNFSNSNNITDFIESNNVIIKKDHHFYENIVKYNHFYAGWDDSDNIELSTTSNGYKTAISPNKLNYRNFYDKSVESYQFSDIFLNIILINHFISMLDALVINKISNNNLSLSFDYNSKINFYEANLSLNFR